MTLAWEDIVVKEGDYEEIPCDCCGKITVECGGELENAGQWLGFYWTRHAKGHPEAFPTIKIGTGDWSENAAPNARWVFGVEVNVAAEGFGLLDLSASGDSSVATYLDRDDILNTSFAQEGFAMLDAIYMKDSRLAEWKT